MKATTSSIAMVFSLFIITISNAGFSQVAVTPNQNHKMLLKSADPKLEQNKRLVYDFWREVLEAGHTELAEKYMAETYIQHNPNVPTGRKGLIDMISKFGSPRSIADNIKALLISIVTEGDFVVLSFVSELPEPKDPAKKYTTTTFDMFRIENGKVAEHWDTAPKR